MRSDGSYQRARYARLKAERRCVDCTAGLQDDDGVQCVECRDKRNDAHARNGKRYLETAREGLRRRYAKDPVAAAARMREYKLRRKLAGLCAQCVLPALPDSNLCELHREASRLHSRNWRRKQRGKPIDISPVPKSGRVRPRRVIQTPPDSVPPLATRDVVLSLIGWLTTKPVRALVAELRDLGITITQRNIERHLHNLVREGVLERVAFDGSRDSNARGYVLAKSARRAA